MSEHFLNIPSVYKLGIKWIGHIPRHLSYVIAQFFAVLSYLFYRSSVNNVKQNLRMALPLFSETKISSLTLRIFRNYSKYLVDYGRFTHLDKKAVINKIISFDGEENLLAALQMNKGIILLTAHLGNWELGGIFFGSYGLKMNVVTITDTDTEIDHARRQYREKHNVKTIALDSPFSSIEMLKALENREVVAMLVDRYHEGLDSVTVNFFNKPTKFPKGPFVLSRLSGAPIIVAFVIREGNAYKGIIEKPLIITGEEGVDEAIQRTVKILERYIIMYPDQWYNFTPL